MSINFQSYFLEDVVTTICVTPLLLKHFQNFIWFLQQPYEIGVVSFIFRVSKIQLTVVIKTEKQNLYQSFMTLEDPTWFFELDSILANTFQ